MKNARSLLYFSAVVVWMLIPTIVLAQGLVPCGNSSNWFQATACNFCDLGRLIQAVINFTIGLAISVAALLFAWAGVVYFTAGGDPGKYNQAQRIFKHVFLGFVLALTAWLIVQTVLYAIFKTDYYKGWNTIQCSENRPREGSIGDLLKPLAGLTVVPLPQQSAYNSGIDPYTGCRPGDSLAGSQCVSTLEPLAEPYAPAPTGASALNIPVLGSKTCSDCTPITAGFQIKNNANVSAGYNNFLSGFSTELGNQGVNAGDIAVTEAWPPTSQHSASCHYVGTCTDIGFRGNLQYNNATINQIQTAASNAGGCAVYETNSAAACAGISSCKVYSHVTAPHFSLYANSSCK